MSLPRFHQVWRSAPCRLATALVAIVFAAACTDRDVPTIAAPSQLRATSANQDVAPASVAPRVFPGISVLCALDAAGHASCWGSNYDGQIGDGTTIDRPVPTPVSGGLTFSTIVSGSFATCGLSTTGVPYCWGGDKERNPWQTDNRLVPRAVRGNDVYTTIAMGDQDACGITTLGETKCWGVIWHDAYVPQIVPGAPAFVSLTAGSIHWCGVASSKLAYCWGFNGTGQVGNGSTKQQYAPLGPDLYGRRYVSLSAGAVHTCDTDLGGTAYCWGQNYFGAVGDASNTERDVPTRVVTTLRFTKVTSGNSHSCGLTSAGAAYCWGNGYEGQVGNGVFGQVNAPVPVQQGTLVFRDLVAGGYNTCGTTTDDKIYCWGYNSYGQLLDGARVWRPVPVLMPL